MQCMGLRFRFKLSLILHRLLFLTQEPRQRVRGARVFLPALGRCSLWSFRASEKRLQLVLSLPFAGSLNVLSGSHYCLLRRPLLCSL